jgi:methylmalonyl-CoA/ethylmalonyl-CoA epimerase
MLRKELAMDLYQVAQHADDLDRATAFYTAVLGGELIASFDPPGLVFIRLGPVRLLLDRAAPSALIYLSVDDVNEQTRDLAAKGVEIDTEPHGIYVDTDGVFGEPGWTERMAFIRDSESNLVGLASRHAPGDAD